MKVIFLDIDGTLVNYQLQLPESAVKAVREAIKKGNRIYLTTGRSRAEVYPNLWELGIQGMIGGNGMYIEDDGDIIRELTMTAEDVGVTVNWMKEKKLGFYLESKNGLFASELFPEKAAGFLHGGDSAAALQQLHKIFPEMNWSGNLYRSDVAKISFLLEPGSLEEAVAKFGDRLKVSTWTATGKAQEFGEFAIKGIDKVSAVKLLLKHLKVDVQDTFAFGDARPDIQMVRYCQVGVAMGNAEECLKEAADYITDGVDEDGLWNAFERFGLL